MIILQHSRPAHNATSKYCLYYLITAGFRLFIDFDIRDDLEDCHDDRMCIAAVWFY